MRNTPRASLVAQAAVSRAHTRTPSAGWPAASTTTPVMAPTPVVSCAAAAGATSVTTTALSAATREATEDHVWKGMDITG